MATLQGLIDAVNDLQDSVTNLTEEVNVRKDNLDSAIDLAQTAQLAAENAAQQAIDSLTLNQATIDAASNALISEQNAALSEQNALASEQAAEDAIDNIPVLLSNFFDPFHTCSE